MTLQYTAFFKRQHGGIDGVFTLQSFDPVHKLVIKVFDRLPARSGNRKNPDAIWTTGIGAIPTGTHFLWLKDPVDPGPDLPTTAGGIGKAYRISNSGTDHDTIYGPGGQKRSLVRLHPENCFKGSAGCIALVWNVDGTLTPILEKRQKVAHLFQFLDSLAKTQEFIPLKVL